MRVLPPFSIDEGNYTKIREDTGRVGGASAFSKAEVEETMTRGRGRVTGMGGRKTEEVVGQVTANQPG